MENKDKVILDLCGGTGAWSRPYKEAGYDVKVITLPEYDVTHPQVQEMCISLRPYGVLAAPPCTEFAVSGARWWRSKPPEKLEEGLRVFDACIRVIQHGVQRFWALENPVGRLKMLRYSVLGEPTMTFNPCDFGDPYTKKTLLWGRFNPPRKTPITPEFRTYKNGKKFAPNYGWSSNESRSVTPPGFAKAFFLANQ